jgi:ferritin
MDNQVVSALQEQFNRERYNAQVYFAIADAMENMAYDGFAKFFRGQAQGELEHARKFAEFLISKRVNPEYMGLSGVSLSADSVVELARAAFNRELDTTRNLENLYTLADDNNTPQVCALLDWFLVEQIEEETWSADLLDLVTEATQSETLFMLDEKYDK